MRRRSSQPHRFRRAAGVIALAAMVMTSCSQSAQSKAEQRIAERTKQLQDLARKLQATKEELAGMDIPGLADQLQADSERQLEPFNSLAYQEMVSRGQEAADPLRGELTSPDRASMLGLLALRQMSQPVYRELDTSFRVSVLIDSLRSSRYFNAWGLPHLYWEEPAKAIIEEGRAAQKPLTELLQDVRPAPMWGEEEVVEYQRYQYRVKDYAWALLLSILGEKVDIPTDPGARDELIAQLSEGPG